MVNPLLIFSKCSFALILNAAIEFVLMSEFKLIFKGPASFTGSAATLGDAVGLGLSLLPFVVFDCGRPECWPGDGIDELDEDELEGA